MWLIDLVVHCLLEWLFQRHAQWLWILAGLLFAGLGLAAMGTSLPTGLAITGVGGLAVAWGVLSIFRGGDE